MRKHITSLITLLFISSLSYSQCTPDLQYTNLGFYSSIGKNKLPNATIGVAYNEVITIVVPKDTGIFKIDSVVLTGVANLPAGIVYSAPTNTILGGTSGCVLLSGKPLGGPGTIPIALEAVLYLTGAGSVPLEEKIDIVVDWPVSTKEENIDFNKVRIAPNPVKGKTTFFLNNKITGEVSLSIHNLLGEEVFNVIHFSEELNSEIEFDASNLPSGIYTYTLSSNESQKMGRLIIAEK